MKSSTYKQWNTLLLWSLAAMSSSLWWLLLANVKSLDSYCRGSDIAESVHCFVKFLYLFYCFVLFFQIYHYPVIATCVHTSRCSTKLRGFTLCLHAFPHASAWLKFSHFLLLNEGRKLRWRTTMAGAVWQKKSFFMALTRNTLTSSATPTLTGESVELMELLSAKVSWRNIYCGLFTDETLLITPPKAMDLSLLCGAQNAKTLHFGKQHIIKSWKS